MIFFLLYNSRLHLLPGKFMFKWSRPFFMVRVFTHCAIEIQCDSDDSFKVNGQHVKNYMGNNKDINVCENDGLDEV